MKRVGTVLSNQRIAVVLHSTDITQAVIICTVAYRWGIAQRLVISEGAVSKHTASIFLRLGLQPSEDDNRRVLAVLAYLGT